MGTRKRILLVAKVRVFLELERSFFSREEVEVTVARDGQEALNVLRALRPDLVIMDLDMAEGDGLCRRIKDDPVWFTIPVILLAAGGAPGEVERCRVAGCDAIVGKPLDRQELLVVARHFLKLAERAAPRVPVRMLVHFGVRDHKTLHDYSCNLGAGGLFLETAHIVPVATQLSLSFLVPGCPEEIDCQGRVVWINLPGDRSHPGLPAGLGIRFGELPPRQARALRDFVFRTWRKEV